MASFIQTFTGKMIDPLNAKPESLCIEDIAHALSNVCRYTGHVSRFYSVAEHCVTASWLIVESGVLTPTLTNLQLQRLALMHDATEAYMMDLSSPLKHAPIFAPYVAAESRLERVIAKRFNLPRYASEIPEVKHVDLVMLAYEKSCLMPHSEPWEGLPPIPEYLETMPLGWDPWVAEKRFLEYAERLGIE